MPALAATSRLTVAFATDRHAEYAMRYLDRLEDPTLIASLRREPSSDLAFVDVDCDAATASRVSTLLQGAHGILV